MKKLTNYFLCWILAISLLLTVAATMVFAVDNALQSTATQVTGEDTFTVSFTQPTDITVASLSLDISFDNSAFEIVSIENAPYANMQPGIEGCNLDGVVSITYTDPTNVANTQIVKGTVLLAATFKIKDGASAGPKSFSVTQYYLEGGTIDEYGGFQDITPDYGNSALTVSIVESSGNETTDDYIVTVANPSSDLVAKGGEFTVNVNVNNAYNSAKIELSYDSNVLEVVSCAAAEDTDNTCSFNYATAGTILILDYGAENATDADYTVTFRAKDATTGTDVKVVSAGISTAEKAAVEDLTPVDEENRGTVTIPVGYTVSVPTTGDHIFASSAPTVLPDRTVVITPDNPYYDYELEATNAILTKNQDGTWTLSGVTENSVITVKTSTPKKYDVTVKTVDKDGNSIAGIDDVVTSDGATYGVQYQYTLPDDEEVVGGLGTSYSLVSIMVGNKAGVYSTSDRTSTIEGQNVTGDIVITIRKEDKDPNAFNVTMDGETSAGQLSATQVAKERDAVLKLTNKLAGYIYSVTATMGGQSVQVAQSGDVYTVANVTGNVVFTISKSLDVTNLDVVEYLSLDGKTMWLAKISGEIAGKTYAYKISENESANFFWSSKYDAYCYLVVEETSVDITAETVETMVAGKLSLLDNTTAVSITYNGNVNMSKNESGEEVIDVNDAQLVWNMYNAYYSDFTQVSVEKFLRADMDSEIGIGTNDAAEIIKLIPKN